jgi:hypothetical protein
MIGGQLLDLEGEGRPLALEDLQRIHGAKTGALIAAAATIGGRAAGAPSDALTALARYGEAIGLAFQIADDVLDVTSTTSQLGKTAGRDLELRKSTYPALLGIDGARARASALVEQGCSALDEVGLLTPALSRLRTSRSSARLRFHRATSLLDRIASPADLRALTRDEHARSPTRCGRPVDVVSRTGGHIGAGLGGRAHDRAPRRSGRPDQLVWDVGHQGYPHKLLTGRNAQMETLRQEGGSPAF